MTAGDVRLRTGDRAGFRECLACQREAWARRYRDNRDDINRARCALAKARSQGLTLKRRGEVFSVFDGDGHLANSGDIAATELWLECRFA